MLPVFDTVKNLLERGEATPYLYTAEASGTPPAGVTVGPSLTSYGANSGSMRLVVILLAVLILVSLIRR